jgi:glycosyltransferase involved in cell wall biosynthesis
MLPVRRLEFVIEAFARVLLSVPDATLYMVGGENAEDIEALRSVARGLRIDAHVVFTGNLPRAEALSFAQAADVCLSPLFPTPILNAASSTKLVEYMALAKPVVGNHHPEQSRVIDESGAGLCVPYEVSPFADAITALLENPQLAQTMGKRGRAYVAEFRSYPRIADSLANIYRLLTHADRDLRVART